MSIGNTNSIYNSEHQRKKQLDFAVRDKLAKKHSAQKRLRRSWGERFHLKPATCSQCKRGMDKKIAKLQIENKRENAPICIPCIIGIKRRPLSEVVNERR